jgi:hypothetical protein
MDNPQEWLEGVYHRIFNRRFPGATIVPAPDSHGRCIVNIPMPEPGRPNRYGQSVWITIDPFVFDMLAQINEGVEKIERNISTLVQARLLVYNPDDRQEEVFHIDIDGRALDD